MWIFGRLKKSFWKREIKKHWQQVVGGSMLRIVLWCLVLRYNNIFIVTRDLNNSYKKLLRPYKTYSLDWWQIESRLIICDKICKRKYTNFGYNHFLGAPILPIKQFDIDKFKPKKLFYSVTKNTPDTSLQLNPGMTLIFDNIMIRESFKNDMNCKKQI